MLAIVEQGDAALSWNLKALQRAESSDNPRAQNWLGSLYNNIGWTSSEKHSLSTNPESIRIARWCIARTLRPLG